VRKRELSRAALVPLALVAISSFLVLPGCGNGSDESATTGGAAESEAPESAGEKSGFEGAEEDVEGFGSEAEGSDKDAVLAAEHGYLSALASEDYGRACSLLSKSVTASLQGMVEGNRPVSCGEILPRLLSPAAVKISAQQARGEVVRVRLEGERAIVVFRAPGARLWAMPLSRGGDEWRVTTLSAAVLAPSASTIE